MSIESHKSQILPIKNRVVPIDSNCAALFHYDITEKDALNGIYPLGHDSALDFDANLRYVHVKGSSVFNIQTNLTMEAWVYLKGSPTADRHCIVINGSYYLTVTADRRVSVYWYGKSPEGYHNSNDYIPLNTWTHIAAVWDAANVYIYINGILNRTIACTGTGNISPSGLIQIGSEVGGGRYSNGRINDIRIWNRSLSGEELKNNLTRNLTGQEQGLVGWWKLNEKILGIVVDSSPYGHDGKMTNCVIGPGRSDYTLHPDGYFGGCVRLPKIEPAINLFASSFDTSFESLSVGNTAGFTSQFPAGSTMEVSTERAYGGTKSLKLVGTGVDGRCYRTISVTNGNWITASAWVYSTVPNSAWIFLEMSGGNYSWVGTNGAKHTGSGWERLTVTFQEALTSNATCYCFLYSSVTSNPTYWDNIQIENKATASDYVDVTLAGGRLEYPNPIEGSSDFTISFWAKRAFPSSSTEPYLYIGDNTGTNSISFEFSSNQIRMIVVNSANVISNVSGAGFNPATWGHITGVKDGSSLKLYINGVLSGTLPMTGNFVSTGKMEVGRKSTNPTIYGNVAIDELRIDKVARTHDEIMAWYYSNSPFWPKGIYKAGY